MTGRSIPRQDAGQRHSAEPAVLGIGVEDAAMAAGLIALGDDRVDPGRGDLPRLGKAGRGGEENDSASLSARTRSAEGNPK